MGKCFSRIKAKPALQPINESATRSRGWKRNFKRAFCMGKHPAVVEPCEIQDNVTKKEVDQKDSAVELCKIQDTVTKTEAEQRHFAQVKPRIIRDIVTKAESEKYSHENEPCKIQDIVAKSESVQNQDSQVLDFDTLHRVAWNLDLPSLAFSPEAATRWEEEQQEIAENETDYTYKLAFPQPASDYMAFREKLDRCCVSLENVILRDSNVLGTIKVKNICLAKRVFVRVTFDSWLTSQDIEAKYVQPYGGNLVNDYDTFSFEFDIDTQPDTNKEVQFAVCFETPTGQHWDNNNGANYEFIPYENFDLKVDEFY